MPFSPRTLLAVAASFCLALILTPLVRALARRYDFVAAPKSDRWHKKPTAMLGGVAIWLSVLVTTLIFSPEIRYGKLILLTSTFLFVVGLIDDVIHTKPYQKLIGQILGSAFVVYYGLTLPWTGSVIVNMALAIFWLIGITNAINLLDNMDGLASGIAVIAAGFLALSFVNSGQFTEALVLLIFAAALLGFLVYNSHPASIFMGDCGSMFVGFFLASSALMNVSGGRSRSFLPVLAVPILVLFIPIFDTTFVTVLRKLSGRAASQGGRDHTSHRLVALGMSERHAVWMLYGFAALSGLLAILVQRARLDVSLAAIAGFTIVLTLIAITVCVVVIRMARQLRDPLWAVGLGLLLAGALGNLTDRIFRSPGPLQGHVVDTISLFAPDGSVWPVFNLADSSIVTGGVLLVLLALTGRELDGTRVPRQHAAAADTRGRRRRPAPPDRRPARWRSCRTRRRPTRRRPWR